MFEYDVYKNGGETVIEINSLNYSKEYFVSTN